MYGENTNIIAIPIYRVLPYPVIYRVLPYPVILLKTESDDSFNFIFLKIENKQLLPLSSSSVNAGDRCGNVQ